MSEQRVCKGGVDGTPSCGHAKNNTHNGICRNREPGDSYNVICGHCCTFEPSEVGAEPAEKCQNCGEPIYYSESMKRWRHHATSNRLCKQTIALPAAPVPDAVPQSEAQHEWRCKRCDKGIMVPLYCHGCWEAIRAYLLAACTENECKLCRLPPHHRSNPDMKHSGLTGMADPTAPIHQLPPSSGDTAPPKAEVEPPARVWIDRWQLNDHRKHGNYYLFNFNDETAIEYVPAEPIRKALKDCEARSVSSQLSDNVMIVFADWEALKDAINK